MKTLKIALIATLLAGASTTAFANGMTDKDAQVVNLHLLQHYYGTRAPYRQTHGSAETTER